MTNIKFGTDGFRAVIAKDFTFENVEKVIVALAAYVTQEYGKSKLFLIGYDPRFMADKFALFAAEILVKYGFNVKLSENVVPTPILAFNAKVYNAAAIMFTASHNPPEYLGIKYIPDYAGPATTEITDSILSYLDKKQEYSKEIGNIEKVSFKDVYYHHIQEIIDFHKIKQLKTKIIFDGLHSAACGYFDEILDNNNIEYRAINMTHHPLFEGKLPEPKPKYLQVLIEKIKNSENTIGMSNDGDADRFGVINERGEYVSPNEIIAILLKHLKTNKNYEGALVKTVGASSLLDLIAQKYGIKVIETPVGFKWVGEAMRNNDTIIGGEESGGLSIKNHIPEKDGLLANLLILEAMAYSNKKLYELQEDLYNDLKLNFYSTRLDFQLQNNTLKDIIINYFKESFENINGFKVTKKLTLDGVKIFLEDNSWILVRASGTEPLLRVYFESNAKNSLNSLVSSVDNIVNKIVAKNN